MALKRAQFLALTGLDIDGHTNMQRRDVYPVQPSYERSYNPFAAYAYRLSDRLAQAPDGHGMNRVMSGNIIRDCARMLVERAAEIDASAEMHAGAQDWNEIISGEYGAAAQSILAGRLVLQGFKRGFRPFVRPFVGTPAELALVLSEHNALDVILTNATTHRVVFNAIARREGIDVADMWPDPSTFPTWDEICEERAGLWNEVHKESYERRRAAEATQRAEAETVRPNSSD